MQPFGDRVLAAARASWRALGIGADTQGRIGFALGTFTAFIGATTALTTWFGMTRGIVVSGCAVVMLVGFWMAGVAVRRSERAAAKPPVGTLILPGHNAIVTGEQGAPGEWVPPGFTVTTGVGPISDDKGNAILGGKDSRIYGGSGNTTAGTGSQCGKRPY